MNLTDDALLRFWREAALRDEVAEFPATWLAQSGWPGATQDDIQRLVQALYETVLPEDLFDHSEELEAALTRHFGVGIAGPQAFLNSIGLLSKEGLARFVEDIDTLYDQLLTHLEVWEAQQTRYGIYDTRMTGWDLFQSFPGTIEVQRDSLYLARELALRCLMANHLLLPLKADGPCGSWVIRSRATELVRLITNLRQRFPEHLRHTQSPRLVREVKYEVVPREVPNRSIDLDTFLEEGLSMVKPSDKYSQANLKWARTLLAKVFQADGKTGFAPFQKRAFQRIITRAIGAGALKEAEGTVVAAGTGSGKTLSYFAPALYQIILEWLVGGRKGTKTVAIYPRRKLAEKQFDEFLRLVYHLNCLSGGARVTLAIEYGGTPYDWDHLFKANSSVHWERWPATGAQQGLIFPPAMCPAPKCGGRLYIPLAAKGSTTQRHLRCTNPHCTAAIPLDFVRVTKEELAEAPPDVLVAVTESLNDRLMSPQHQTLFGDDQFCAPSLIMVDEIHLHTALQGMQVGYLLRRLKARLAAAPEAARGNTQFVGLSATIGEAQEFFHELTGVSRYHIQVEQPDRTKGETRVVGAEYYLFVKPHSNGDAAILSTLIQTAMVVVHNMWQPANSTYKTFGFVNSLDIAYRWNERMTDAETTRKLYELRAPKRIAADPGLQNYFYSQEVCNGCHSGPRTDCLLFQEGECWWFMEHGRGMNRAADIDVVTSRGGHPEKDLVIATSSLEVGYDDPSVMAVLQYLSPHNPASFVQRKGRGGRTVGTRPLMVTVLSPYRATDIFNFQNHHRLLDPLFRKLPLNPENRLVRRIHGFYALFDWLAWKAARQAQGRGLSPEGPSLNLDMVEFIKLITAEENNLGEFRHYLAGAFGVADSVISELLSEATEGVLAHGLRNLVREAEDYFSVPKRFPKHVKDFARSYVPQNFFSDINLPEVQVTDKGGKELERGKVALGLSETSLGKVSFRWESPHWVPLNQGVTRGRRTLSVPLDSFWKTNEVGKVPMSRVPERMQRALEEVGLGKHLTVYRPVEIKVEPFRRPGRADSAWRFDPDTGLVYAYQNAPPGAVTLTDRTTSYPLSFYEIQFDREEFTPHLTTARQLGLFGGTQQRVLTGIVPLGGQPWLQARKIYAGAEATLQGSQGREHSWTVAYEGANQEAVALGFALETEGIAFTLNRDIGHLLQISSSVLEHLRYNLFRHGIYRWAQLTGENIFTVQRAVDVLLTLTGLQRLPMTIVVTEWVQGRLDDQVREVLQLIHGGLSTRNRNAVIDLLASVPFRDRVPEVARDSFEAKPVDFIRDTFVHSLKHVLKKATQVLAGAESAEDLAGWVQLKSEYPNPSPDLVLFEVGMYGTGLMKPVHKKLQEAPEEFWREVEHLVMSCPVATEEAFMRQVITLDEGRLIELAVNVRAVEEALGPDASGAAMTRLVAWFRTHAGGYHLRPEAYRSLRKVFIRPFEIQGYKLKEPIHNWRLYREVERYRCELAETFGRAPSEAEVRNLLYESIRRGGDHPGLQSLFALNREHRSDLFDSRIASFEANLQTKETYRQFARAASSLDHVRELSERPEQERQLWLAQECGVADKWLASVDEALFSVLGGKLSYAEVYWRIHHHALTPELQEEIEEALIAQTLQDAIGRRVLQSCLDGCPDCLEGPCELDSPLHARQTLSRQLLRDFFLAQKEVWQVPLDPALPKGAVAALGTLLASGAPRAYLRYRAGDDAAAARVVAQLKLNGVRLPDDQEYPAEIHSTGIAHLDLAGVCQYEICLQLRGR